MTLIELQRSLQAWLTTGADETATRFGAGAGAGLSVYQNNYRAQLMGCLEQSFPQVRGWMGEEAFRVAAISHIDDHPPHSWTLDLYPQSFPATLAALYPDNPDLHELVWIEQALSDAFVGPDAEPLSTEALGAIDWDTVRLTLTPTFVSRPATTNAEQIWSALQKGDPAPEGMMLAEPGGLIVWRLEFGAYLRQVDETEYKALLELDRRGSFAAVCSMLAERLGDEAGVGKAADLLVQWLRSGLIMVGDTCPRGE